MKRRVRKWTDEQLREAVATCNNLSDVLRQLGLRVAGGNHKSIQKWITELNLNCSHFSKEKQLKGLESRKTLDLQEVLCYDSKVSRNALKRFAKKLIQYECTECKNVGLHNGKPLTLQIDHINGIPNDNRLENLRWLCPNCHTQTDTFAGKKK
jgi:5-methylcytosine-specific restriction endonuclease McrA